MKNIMEIWKKIDGYEFYEISNYGRVKSLKFGKERIMVMVVSSRKNGETGYLKIVLSQNNYKKTYTTHLLVWDHFSEKLRDGNKLVVDHIDENKLNNHIDNLQLLTQRSNILKSIDKTKKTSKYTGVCWDKSKKKWVAQINFKKVKKIGTFNDEYEAHLAYKKELEKI